MIFSKTKLFLRDYSIDLKKPRYSTVYNFFKSFTYARNRIWYLVIGLALLPFLFACKTFAIFQYEGNTPSSKCTSNKLALSRKITLVAIYRNFVLIPL